MIDLFYKTLDADVGQLVMAALKRSVSSTQVEWRTLGALGASQSKIIVAINPTEDFGHQLLARLQSGDCKMLFLGHLPACLVSALKLQPLEWPSNLLEASRSSLAPTYGYAESQAVVRYRPVAAKLKAANWSRPFERFDFTDEWNNLGYGAIRADQSIWAIAQPLKADLQHEVAGIEVGDVDSASYCGLFDDFTTSVLWINRPVGLIDTYEWRLVEYFMASYRSDELPCQPVIHEIPWGYDAAITMRLDCDEDVESARPLWSAYREMQIPFSLAIHTTNLSSDRHDQILKEMALAGESLLSHTATHAPNWGGSYEAALQEGIESATRIRSNSGHSVRYAVSPFHQTPDYALKGLADAGFLGVIGGIIRNDPEFLIARGGELAGLPNGFVGHSQQTMLHGDCMLSEGDPLAIFKAAFDRAQETKTLFGYLDHPFSERYQYGWSDEASRVTQHRSLVKYIRSQTENPIFLSEDEAMDFLRDKMQWHLRLNQGRYRLEYTGGAVQPLSPTVEYRGELTAALDGAMLS